MALCQVYDCVLALLFIFLFTENRLRITISVLDALPFNKLIV